MKGRLEADMYTIPVLDLLFVMEILLFASAIGEFSTVSCKNHGLFLQQTTTLAVDFAPSVQQR